LLKETKTDLRNIEKLDEYQNYDYNIDEQINELELSINNFKREKIQLDDEHKDKNDELNKLFNQLKPIDNLLDYEILDKQEIHDNIKLLSDKLVKYNKIDFDNQIEDIYNENLSLSAKLESLNDDIDLDDLKTRKTELNNEIVLVKSKISKLNLIRNKQTIILKNDNFEKEKMGKIILLNNKITSDLKIIPRNKISNKILENLNQIFANINIQEVESKINNSKILILNLDNNINQLYNTISDLGKMTQLYDDINDVNEIEKIYNTINYDEYCNNMRCILSEYDEYNELNKIIEANYDILTLLNSFNKCIKHSNDISQYFFKIENK